MIFRSLYTLTSLVAVASSSSSLNLRGKETDNQYRHLNVLQTITSIVNSNNQFDTLETALKTTGLNKTLAGLGPFTVFAPTDSVSRIRMFTNNNYLPYRFCKDANLAVSTLSHFIIVLYRPLPSWARVPLHPS
jgi:Fasciclin domain